ncbi:hypothetical protein TNCV_2065911 [Trichonephila clavipes]|nr:hypothetical protein TNCV_2065911 [Trichonephila clavipes]
MDWWDLVDFYTLRRSIASKSMSDGDQKQKDTFSYYQVKAETMVTFPLSLSHFAVESAIFAFPVKYSSHVTRDESGERVYETKKDMGRTRPCLEEPMVLGTVSERNVYETIILLMENEGICQVSMLSKSIRVVTLPIEGIRLPCLHDEDGCCHP